jgi:lipopolysaccharide/colanic/teichoic acid biosynthesis glycosyltransferase
MKLFFKRVIDLTISIVLTLILSPLLLLISAAVKFDSPGPALFIQERRGHYFNKFKMFKFRTLRHNASDPHLKYEMVESDPRITRVGKFLRKTSLDELPQLFNVIIGNMSLVGPRPLVEWESCECLQTHPLRFEVKPGITGLSQVYARNSVDLSARSDLDIEYANNWSNSLDLKILFISPVKLFLMKGIYPEHRSTNEN